MSKFDDALEKAKSQLDSLGHSYDSELLSKVAKGLGPSIYNADAASVATSQKTELETVKHNFVINKLGVTNGTVADEAIAKVADLMKDAKLKSRINFYYLLVKELGKEELY